MKHGFSIIARGDARCGTSLALWQGVSAAACTIVLIILMYSSNRTVCDRRARIHRLKGAAMAREQISRILRITAAAAMVVFLSATFATLGMAAEGRGHWGEGWHGHEGPHWEQGNIGRFHEEDLDRWHGGHWFHGEHLGRPGWWWIVGRTWYFYPAAVYPYPDPYVPPVVVTPAPPQLTQCQPQYGYDCPSAKGYYLYVADCPEGWNPVVPRPTAP
jgi:hypothetical protein